MLKRGLHKRTTAKLSDLITSKVEPEVYETMPGEIRTVEAPIDWDNISPARKAELKRQQKMLNNKGLSK